MTEKRCLVFETLGKLSDLQVMESANKNEMRLSGVFGVCGVKNQNNRIYDRDNYAQMVESLQKVIAETGCPGELEHPNSMNINLNNVSHKIESIEMNEDGTITGTILLLNTRQGQQAKAIVEGGLPLFISSRGAGTITNEGKVTLSTIKTYDLVGTPGFSQAKLTLKANQKLECLNEGLDEGSNETWIVVEGDDDLLSTTDDSDDKSKDKSKDKSDDKSKDKSDDKSKDKSDDKSKDKSDDEDDECKSKDCASKDQKKNDDDNKNNDNVDMNDLKNAIDKLTDQVAQLEADLHVAKESIDDVKLSKPTINYDAIETWIKEQWAPEFKYDIDEMLTEKITKQTNDMTVRIAEGVEKWVVEEFAPEVQNWVLEEFSPEVQNWVVEEFAPVVNNWITEEFAPEVQNWVVEEFSPEVQNWITEEFAPVVDNWITEEFAPEQKHNIEESVNANVSAFLAENSAARLDEIDNLLETIGENKTPLEKVVENSMTDEKYKGIYVVEHMPAQYAPSWQLLSEARKQEIIRNSKIHDFTKPGVLERFWANVDFTQVNESSVKESDNVTKGQNNVFEGIASRMKQLRGAFV